MAPANQLAYQGKKVSADEAVRIIKSGDHIYYGEFSLFPQALDKALARWLVEGDIKDVTIESVCLTRIPEALKHEETRGRVDIQDWHFGAVARKLYNEGLCSYKPLTYHQGPRLMRKYCDFDAVFLTTTPMGPRGNFNFGLCNSISSAALDKTRQVVVETNKSVPRCLGGNQESIHISRVTHAVEEENEPILEIPAADPSPTDYEIAKLLIKEIDDGSCLQLGIGGLPNVIGKLIAESDLKNLGLHTEMLVDSCVDLYEQGKITGSLKVVDRYKMAYTFAMGTRKLYDFLDSNPMCASYPVNYINDPRVIGLNPKVVAINNAIEVDLFSQVASESVGPRHISGTGGQLDFIMGAFYSKGGKGIISMSSTFTDKNGNVKSRIVPTLAPGTVITVPRSMTHFVATEFGIVQMKGKSTWQRAEALISIAHPDFRDELIKQAEKLGIWKRSNR